MHQLRKDGRRHPLAVETPSGSAEITGSHLLLAVGRRPNTNQLGLEAAGVDVDRNGFIVTDEMLRTNVPGIWALGDCNGRGAFTHTSYNDFEIVAANLLEGDTRRAGDRILTYGLFIDPPLGRAGMTEREAPRDGPAAARRDAALVAGWPRGRARGDAGVHEDRGRRRDS